MPKDTDIQSHWADVPSAVETVRSNVVAQKRNQYGGKIFLIVKHCKYLGVMYDWVYHLLIQFI